MTKEDLKFRFYNGEDKCPENTEPFTNGPYILRTFWSLEKYIAKAYGANGIIKKGGELLSKEGEYNTPELKNTDATDGEKAVFVTCCHAVDSNHAGIDETLVDNYFAFGAPHTLEIPDDGNLQVK